MKLKALSQEEKETLQRISRSRTAAQRAVERATMIVLRAEGISVEEIAKRLGRDTQTVYNQIKRFNEVSLDFLQDASRSGRPPIYTEQQRGEMVQAAKTNPQQLNLPFGHWTLDLLVEYVNETLTIPVSRSQLAEILTQEGLKWYQEKTYFSESPDPQFVEKRGRL